MEKGVCNKNTYNILVTWIFHVVHVRMLFVLGDLVLSFRINTSPRRIFFEDVLKNQLDFYRFSPQFSL